MAKWSQPDMGESGQSRLMPVADAAAHLGVSTKTIRRYVDAGKLGSVYDRGRVLVQMAGINALSDVPQKGVQMASAVTVQPVHAPEPPAAPDRELIDELRARIADLQDALETYKRMLPASVSQPRVPWREIVFWAVVLLVLALTAYMVAYTVAPDPATIHRLTVTTVSAPGYRSPWPAGCSPWRLRESCASTAP